MYAGSLGNTICVMGMVASLAVRVVLMLIYWYKLTVFLLAGKMGAVGLISKSAFFLYSLITDLLCVRKLVRTITDPDDDEEEEETTQEGDKDK